MRSGAAAATARGDDVDAEAGLPAAGGVSAAVVRCEELDVLVKFPAVDLVLESVVGKMHLVVEVRQIVVARPVADFVLVTAGSAVTVGAVAVVVLQELLVLALEVLFEDDAPDLEDVVLFSPSVKLPRKREPGMNGALNQPIKSSELRRLPGSNVVRSFGSDRLGIEVV